MEILYAIHCRVTKTLCYSYKSLGTIVSLTAASSPPPLVSGRCSSSSEGCSAHGPGRGGEGGREVGREGGREVHVGREGGREGGGRDRGRWGGREGGREGGRKGEREQVYNCAVQSLCA